LIACEDGEVAIENIRAGDIVNTLSDGPQVVRWVGVSPPIETALISIQPDALSKSVPTKPLLVSPSLRLVIANWQAELLFGSSEVLVTAKGLLKGTGISISSSPAPHFLYQLLFDEHEIICANGAACESFYLSASNLAALDEKCRFDLIEKVPEAEELDPNHPIDLVRPAISAAEAALLE
jgi:hypothetical protein